MAIAKKNGWLYLVKKIHGKKVWRALKTKSMREAQKRAAEAEVAMRTEVEHERILNKKAPQEGSLTDAIDLFCNELRTYRSPTHATRVEHTLNVFAATVGLTDITKVTRKTLADHLAGGLSKKGWAARKKKPWTPRTHNAHRQSLSQFFKWCITQDDIPVEINPAQSLPRATELKTKPTPPRDSDITAVLEACRAADLDQSQPWRELAVVIVLGTGLRPGELYSLKWPHIDLDRKAIHLPAAITKDAEDRIIPFTDQLAATFKQTPKAKRKGLVMPNSKLTMNTRCRQFQEAMQSAGIEDVTLKTMRSWYASTMAEAGVPMDVLQEVLGHSSITTTRRYYAGTSTSRMFTEINKLNTQNQQKG